MIACLASADGTLQHMRNKYKGQTTTYTSADQSSGIC